MLVLTHGCWDILHAGHIEHFQRAKALGQTLVVSLSSDEVVARKGKGRPIYPLAQRVAMVKALRCVDWVYECKSDDGADAILSVKPKLFVQGIDYLRTGPTDAELDACQSVGAQIVVTTHPKAVSTTDIIRRIKRCAS